MEVIFWSALPGGDGSHFLSAQLMSQDYCFQIQDEERERRRKWLLRSYMAWKIVEYYKSGEERKREERRRKERIALSGVQRNQSWFGD